MQGGIFVSYSHKDAEAVEQIVSIIKKESGQDVWFDHNLRGGENYFSVIANQIIKNKYFVFVVSNNSIESDWCLRELEFAASEKRRIIAVWLDDVNVSPRIKLIIQNTHYINWYSTTEKLFTQTVALAFSADAEASFMPKTESNGDDLIPKNQKYFLSAEQIKRLQALLRAEEKGQYSVCFEPENANLLGIAYELGVMVEQDDKKALLYYKASDYAGNPDGQYLHATIMRKHQPMESAHLEQMLDAAEKGGVIALTNIGDDYYFGKNGLPIDKVKAYEYFERAAKAGGVMAMYCTGYGYNSGEIRADYELAYMYALKAKEGGFPRAYRLLGYMYKDGYYVKRDYLKAIEMFDEAIKRGDYLCYCYKGEIFGLLDQTDKKIELYKKAAELADKNEIKSGTPYYRMAVLYEGEAKFESDYDVVSQYYLKAAERKHKTACRLAVFYILKTSGERKLEYLKRAFELRCENAAYELGKFEKEKQDDKNAKLSEEAIGYFKAGGENGDMRCIEELISNYCFVIGKGKGRNDRLEAIKWFGFLFANADEHYIDLLRKNCSLSTYYYAYAIELDFDPDVNMPDREFVLYYFKKSVEESPQLLGKIIGFAVNGYLFPDESKSGLTTDVIHTEELLAFVEEKLGEYHDWLKNSGHQEEWELTIETLKKGYNFIAECYETGKNVPKKDKEKAKKYRDMAKKMQICCKAKNDIFREEKKQ